MIIIAELNEIICETGGIIQKINYLIKEITVFL